MEKVLDLLNDELSKKIYINRIAYNAGDIDSFENILADVYGGSELIDFMNKYKKLYVFGAGILGREFVNTYIGGRRNLVAYIDNKKNGCVIDGLKVLSPEELEINDDGIIVVNKYHTKEIISQLHRKGIADSHIFDFSKYQLVLNQRQYFDTDFVDDNIEGFVDCGALDGKSSINALYRWSKIKRIWAFEPDSINAKKCAAVLDNLCKETKVIHKALWSCDTILKFNEEANGMSGINENGQVSVSTTTLDKEIPSDDNLFIKMDIEGAEIEALKGAENIISSCKPKLAICIYHKPEDIYNVPELLLSFNPNYRFYIRHYSLTSMETVLYAV